MDKNSNSLNWFEIPATDLNRAKSFYEAIFATTFEPISEMMGMRMATFPAHESKVSGALVQSDMHVPSADGSLVYLNANPSIQAVADRVVANGGTLLMPPMEVSPEIGFMAMIMDTEGNKVALHAGTL